MCQPPAATGPNRADPDPDLSALMAAWPSLSSAARRAVLAAAGLEPAKPTDAPADGPRDNESHA